MFFYLCIVSVITFISVKLLLIHDFQLFVWSGLESCLWDTLYALTCLFQNIIVFCYKQIGFRVLILNSSAERFDINLKCIIFNFFYGLILWALHIRLILVECYRPVDIMSALVQVIASTWANVDSDLLHHIASLGHNVLMKTHSVWNSLFVIWCSDKSHFSFCHFKNKPSCLATRNSWQTRSVEIILADVLRPGSSCLQGISWWDVDFILYTTLQKGVMKLC